MILKELLELKPTKTTIIISLIKDNNKTIGVVNVVYKDIYLYEGDYPVKESNKLNDEALYYKLELEDDEYSSLNVIFDLSNNRILVLKSKYIKSIAKELKIEYNIDPLPNVSFKLNNTPELINNIKDLSKKCHIIDINKFKSIPITEIWNSSAHQNGNNY